MINPVVPNAEVKKDKNWSNSVFDYGYFWWSRSNNDVSITMAQGYLGQFLIIDKKNNVVACRLIEPKWGEPTFDEAFKDGSLFFNDFPDRINRIVE